MELHILFQIPTCAAAKTFAEKDVTQRFLWKKKLSSAFVTRMCPSQPLELIQTQHAQGKSPTEAVDFPVFFNFPVGVKNGPSLFLFGDFYFRFRILGLGPELFFPNCSWG